MATATNSRIHDEDLDDGVMICLFGAKSKIQELCTLFERKVRDERIELASQQWCRIELKQTILSNTAKPLPFFSRSLNYSESTHVTFHRANMYIILDMAKRGRKSRLALGGLHTACDSHHENV